MPEITFDLADGESWTAYCIYDPWTKQVTPLTEEEARALAEKHPELRAAFQTTGSES